MNILPEVCQRRLWPAKGRFGINHPFDFAQWCEIGGQGTVIGQPGKFAKEGQITSAVRGQQPIQKLVLSRFSSGLFRAMFAMKERTNGKEIHR
jgi:hypothetical protein